MRLDFFECEGKGLLRRTAPSGADAKKSAQKAASLLDEAQRSFESRSYAASLLLAYTAMFHSARAILLQDGWREKSHACIARYLEEKYVKTGKLEQKWIDLLDRFRELRHADLYDLDFSATQKQAGDAVAAAKILIQRMGKLIK